MNPCLPYGKAGRVPQNSRCHEIQVSAVLSVPFRGKAPAKAIFKARIVLPF